MGLLSRFLKDEEPPPSAKQLYKDRPPGVRGYLLRKYAEQIPPEDFERKVSFMSEANQVDGTLVDRNLKGKSLEKSGQVDRAVELYEQNVRDLFHGPHPYERLRILYTKQKRFDDAIRVCQAYQLACETHAEIAPEYSADDDKTYLKSFEWVEKLAAKKAKLAKKSKKKSPDPKK